MCTTQSAPLRKQAFRLGYWPQHQDPGRLDTDAADKSGLAHIKTHYCGHCLKSELCTEMFLFHTSINYITYPLGEARANPCELLARGGFREREATIHTYLE